ncbi:MAG: ABC transporter ATP-binding protein [Vampirovibrionales bacterium]|nr:ABC transporter ATP-binding protein [Vampirovibrionales bacterium]
MSPTVTDTLLSVDNLTVRFPTAYGPAYAVNHLSLRLERGKMLGIVGESGCGKSMTSLAILRLVPTPGEIVSGSVMFDGQDLIKLSQKGIQDIRGAKIALIPQDPLTSLNPVYTIGDQIMEVLMRHQSISKKEALEKTIDLLRQVRIPNAESRVNDYPHQFSGGMRQRAMIAMALSCKPSLLIADEPTTALDVTVQAQILDLLKELQETHNTAILLITHDLGVVAETCDNVAVMYAGRIVEEASVFDLFQNPKHPYTKGLLHSLPTLEKIQSKTPLEPIEGQPPALTEIPKGCAFEPRCPSRMEICTSAFPPHSLIEGKNPASPHDVRCYLYPTPT